MWLHDAVFPVFLATGFAVGFGHCVGMCGPVAVAVSINRKKKPLPAAHILYNAGRITTYTALGALAGYMGAFAGTASGLAGVQKGALIVAGGLIVLMGLSMTGWLPQPRMGSGPFGGAPGLFSRVGRLLRGGSTAVYFPLGLLLGLLPCGPVYTAMVAAAGQGADAGLPVAGAIRGGGILLSFGIGTVPALLLVGRLAGVPWLRRRLAVYRMGAWLMVAIGFYYICRGVWY